MVYCTCLQFIEQFFLSDGEKERRERDLCKLLSHILIILYTRDNFFVHRFVF